MVCWENKEKETGNEGFKAYLASNNVLYSSLSPLYFAKLEEGIQEISTFDMLQDK